MRNSLTTTFSALAPGVGGGSVLELGVLEAAAQPPLVAQGVLVVDEQTEALLEGQLGYPAGPAELILEGFDHAGQAQVAQLVEGLVVHHRGCPLRLGGCDGSGSGSALGGVGPLPGSAE